MQYIRRHMYMYIHITMCNVLYVVHVYYKLVVCVTCCTGGGVRYAPTEDQSSERGRQCQCHDRRTSHQLREEGTQLPPTTSLYTCTCRNIMVSFLLFILLVFYALEQSLFKVTYVP